MALESLLYISRSLLDPATARDSVAALIEDSILRNRDRDLSGALIYTGTHFAQVVEGDPAMVERVLRSLRADPRHTDLFIIERVALAARRFSGWSMAYCGASQFISRQIDRVLDDPSPAELRRGAGWLIELMQEFVAR